MRISWIVSNNVTPPAEYETTGLSENQIEARDRLYEGDWNVAQREPRGS